MKCKYCNKELPKIINGRREICNCDKANKEWSIFLRIQDLKKQLIEENKKLKELEDSQSVWKMKINNKIWKQVYKEQFNEGFKSAVIDGRLKGETF